MHTPSAHLNKEEKESDPVFFFSDQMIHNKMQRYEKVVTVETRTRKRVSHMTFFVDRPLPTLANATT